MKNAVPRPEKVSFRENIIIDLLAREREGGVGWGGEPKLLHSRRGFRRWGAMELLVWGLCKELMTDLMRAGERMSWSASWPTQVSRFLL